MSEMIANRSAETIAAEINMIKAQARDVYVRSAIEIGRRLYEAKTMVAHGRWGKWLEENVDYSERTAQNLIAVYEEYGRSGNAQAIAGLSFTQAVLLLRLDGESRAELLEQKDVPAMSTRELEEEIKRANAEIEKRQITIEQLMQADQERENAQALIDAQNAAAERLREELEQAREEAGRARIQAADAVERANAISGENTRLKAELENERSRPPVIEQREVTPPEVEQELERLREQAKGAEDKEIILLKDAYKRLVEQFKAVEEKINALAAAQPEEAARYRKAVATAAASMAERLRT